MWSATKPKSSRKDVVFPDEEDSLWEFDTRTDEWYLHHFYKHQPDLNVANPKVQEEISRTLDFWLELGVSGFRVDAVPFLFAKDASAQEVPVCLIPTSTSATSETSSRGVSGTPSCSAR